MSEVELLDRARRGDMNAYGELYRTHHDNALRLARSLVADREAASDLVAEAFVKILVQLRANGGPRETLAPYLNTAIRRLAVDTYRRSHQADQPHEPADMDLLMRGEDSTARVVEYQHVWNCFGALPEQWRRALWHVDIEGRPLASLTSTFGLNQQAVAALAYRARRGLRRAYAAQAA